MQFHPLRYYGETYLTKPCNESDDRRENEQEEKG